MSNQSNSAESILILVIDNYDSFVHNLARYFRQLGCETETVRNDQISIESILTRQPDAIVLSPGPGTPRQAGISIPLIEQLAGRIPLLGVCLGHQAIVAGLGGRVVPSGAPMHGRRSLVSHQQSPLFDQIPSPFWAGRYHSLVACEESIPACLHVTARASDQTVMAVEHRWYPMVGIQFHPESILTEHGSQLLKNFLDHYCTANDCRPVTLSGSESGTVHRSSGHDY